MIVAISATAQAQSVASHLQSLAIFVRFPILPLAPGWIGSALLVRLIL